MLFRWFVGLLIEDTVRSHSVFSKNCDRLIEFDAVTDLFNATVEMAQGPGLLSGEHFGVDDTLIHAWASHKSVRRKDGSDDDRPPEDWHGESRSHATHASTSDPESRLYRKSSACAAELSGKRKSRQMPVLHGCMIHADKLTAGPAVTDGGWG
ncbi:hypothetical protein ACO7_570031 [Thiomonas arsenitoxydans]|nr:hypothetical protein ACO3_570032 [Thiomonas arsenitoxydans]CQR39405.1 hypothetical protein ACO7_570031 [Thiomonas arsenitoxydans]CQR44617.1 hypothetical protein THICB3550043 [Thiomonas sp. CB3]